MKYEVEQKYPVSNLAAMPPRFAALGATLGEPFHESDIYFAHPVRDFVQTDEALRLRKKNDEFFVTYKGPKIDQTTKTRQELELPLAISENATFDDWITLFGKLGFKPVGKVEKTRRKARVQWGEYFVEATLDHIDVLGSFVELEIVVEQQDELQQAKASIASLAQALELSHSERCGYLELILLKQKNNSGNHS